MRSLSFTLYIVLFIVHNVHGQSISIHEVAEHATNNLSTFPTQMGSVAHSGQVIRIITPEKTDQLNQSRGWSLSVQGYNIALVRGSNNLILDIFDADSEKLQSSKLEFFDGGDETIKPYIFDSGNMTMRDNVANFTFIDATGHQVMSVSNSSQSSGGEAVSEFRSDKYGITNLLYNPTIRFNGETGSAARIVQTPNQENVIFNSRDEEIQTAIVSDSGSYLLLVTKMSNGDSRVIQLDRFGNELFNQTFEMEVTGASPTPDGNYLTIFSDSRVQVYQSITGERLGSTSLRTAVVQAVFDPVSEVLLVIGGVSISTQINEVEFTAVDLGRREIARGAYEGVLSFLNRSDVKLKHIKNGQFKLEGVNRPLEIEVQF